MHASILILANYSATCKVHATATRLSHLLIADDTFLLFKAERDQAEHVRSTLRTYEMATGQLINPAKCSIMFGKSCPDVVEEHVRNALQVSVEDF